MLLVTGDYLPNIGGLAGHVHELALALHKRGHLVDVLTTVDGLKQDSGPITVHRIPPRLSKRRWIARPQIIKSTQQCIDALQKEGRADIIHWHSLDHFCPALARLKNQAKVFTNHTSHFTAALARGRHQRLKRQIGHADAWITPSQVLYDGTRALGLDESHIHLIFSGVDAERFKPGNQSEARSLLGLEQDKHIVLYAGRVEKVKGTDTLLNAIKELDAELPPEVQFVIVGDHARQSTSVFEAEMDAEAAPLLEKGRLVFLGPKSREDMVYAYQAADIAVLPSRNEATSLTALEAMSTGLPLVASAVGGLLQIIEDGHDGCLVPSDDPSALASALKSLIIDPQGARSLGKNARKKIVRDWTWVQVATRTAEVYEQVKTRRSDHQV